MTTKRPQTASFIYEAHFPSHPLSFPTISFYNGPSEREYPPSVPCSSTSHALPSVSSCILGTEMQSKGMEECGNVDAIWKPGDASQDAGLTMRNRRQRGRLPSPPPAFRCLHPQRKPGRQVHLRSKTELPAISRGSLRLRLRFFFFLP